jgi:hypothetical protein
VQQKKSEYGNKGQGTPAMDGENRTMWIFEPHAAEQVFEDYVKEFGIEVVRDEWLDRAKGVKKDGDKIVSPSPRSAARLMRGRCSSTPPMKAISWPPRGAITTSAARRTASMARSTMASRSACCITAITSAR